MTVELAWLEAMVAARRFDTAAPMARPALFWSVAGRALGDERTGRGLRRADRSDALSSIYRSSGRESMNDGPLPTPLIGVVALERAAEPYVLLPEGTIRRLDRTALSSNRGAPRRRPRAFGLDSGAKVHKPLAGDAVHT
jgi:hypothetical protein